MYIYIYICSSVVCGVSSQLISYSPCTRVVVSDNDTTTTDTRVGDVISSAYVCVCVLYVRVHNRYPTKTPFLSSFFRQARQQHAGENPRGLGIERRGRPVWTDSRGGGDGQSETD